MEFQSQNLIPLRARFDGSASVSLRVDRNLTKAMSVE
jgi:hypothetical protein